MSRWNNKNQTNKKKRYEDDVDDDGESEVDDDDGDSLAFVVGVAREVRTTLRIVVVFDPSDKVFVECTTNSETFVRSFVDYASRSFAVSILSCNHVVRNRIQKTKTKPET